MMKRILAMLTVMVFLFSMTAYAEVDGDKVDGRTEKGEIVKEALVQRPTSAGSVTTGPSINVELQGDEGGIIGVDPGMTIVSEEADEVEFDSEMVPVTSYQTRGDHGTYYRVYLEEIEGHEADVYKWQQSPRGDGSDGYWTYWSKVTFDDYPNSNAFSIGCYYGNRYLVLYEPKQYALNFEMLAAHEGNPVHGSVSPSVEAVYSYGDQIPVEANPDNGYEVDSWWAYFGVDSQYMGMNDAGVYRADPPVLTEIVDVVLPTFEVDGYIEDKDGNRQELMRYYDGDNGDGLYEWTTIYLKLREVHNVDVAVENQNGIGDVAFPTTPAGFLTGPDFKPGETVDLAGETFSLDLLVYDGELAIDTAFEVPVEYVEGYDADVYKFVPESDDVHTYPGPGTWVLYDHLYFWGGYDSFQDTVEGLSVYCVKYEPISYWVGFWTLDETGLVEGANPNGYVDQPGVFDEANPLDPANPDWFAHDSSVDVNVQLNPGYMVDSWWAYFWVYPEDGDGYDDMPTAYYDEMAEPVPELKEIKDGVMPQFEVDGWIESVDSDIKYLPRSDGQVMGPEMIYAKIVEVPTTQTEPTTTTTTEKEGTTTTTEREGTTTTTREGTTTTERDGTTTTAEATTTVTVDIQETTVPQAIVTEVEIEDAEIPETGGIPLAGFSLLGTAIFGFGLALKKRSK